MNTRTNAIAIALLTTFAAYSVVTAPHARAAGEIQDGGARFAWGNLGETDPIFAGFSDLETGFGAPADDHLHQHWFYIRGEEGATEAPLPIPDAESYEGAELTLSWTDVAPFGFDATLRGRIEQPTPGAARLTERLEISNPTGEPIALVLFVYADIDIQLGFGGNPDTAALLARDRVRIDDHGLFDFGEFSSPGAASFEADAWPGLRDFQLLDTGPDDLNETGYPFGPAHYTGAFAWHLSLEPGESAEIPIVLSVNAISVETTRPPFEIDIQPLDPETLRGVTWPGLTIDLDPYDGTGEVASSTFWDRVHAVAADPEGETHAIGNFTLLRLTERGQGRVVAQLDIDTARAMAFRDDGTLFVIVRDGAGADELHTIDTETGATTLVGATGLSGIEGLTFGPDGTLWAWHNGPGTAGVGLVTLDPATGQATDPFPATPETAEIRGLATARDGTLHGAQNALHRIDTTDGTTEEIGGRGYFDLGGIAFTHPR